MTRPSGLTAVLAATAIAGVAGLLATVVVARQIGPEANAQFAVFWSTIYLIITALSGVQQELTRATTTATAGSGAPAGTARNFGIASSVVVLAAVLLSTPLWPESVMGPEPLALTAPLAVGTASYVLVATLAGSLYGVNSLTAAAALVAVDATVRFVALAVTSAITTDAGALAWAVAAPFPLAIIIVWPFIRRGAVRRATIDVGYRRLTRNVSGTIVAAASTGVLVSGFPLLVGVTSPGASAATLGVLLPAITIVRAPLIVAVTALQGILIVRFRDDTAATRTLVRLMAVLAGLTVVATVLGLLIGRPIFVFIFGDAYDGVVDGPLVAALLASSGFVAALTMTGAFVLARGHHAAFTAGWIVAALATLACLAVPIDIVPRVVVALVAGPLAGLAVHAISAAASSRASRGSRGGVPR